MFLKKHTEWHKGSSNRGIKETQQVSGTDKVQFNSVGLVVSRIEAHDH